MKVSKSLEIWVENPLKMREKWVPMVSVFCSLMSPHLFLINASLRNKNRDLKDLLLLLKNLQQFCSADYNPEAHRIHGLADLPTFGVNFHGFRVGKYTVRPMDPAVVRR